MVKKRSSSNIIRGVSDPKVEHAYVKFPGRELMDVTLGQSAKQKSVEFDLEKIKSLADEYGIKKYTELHTHPTGNSIPSGQDINAFLRTPNAKTMVVVSQNPDNGEIEGYYFLRRRDKDSPEYAKLKEAQIREKKEYGEIVAQQEESFRNYELRAKKRNNSWITKALAKVGVNISLKPIKEEDKEHRRKWDRYGFKNLPKEDKNAQMNEDIQDYEKNMMARRIEPGMETLATKYNLDYRFVPEKGYAFESSSQRFKKKGLENKVAVASIISLIGSLFFIGYNFTGNAIGNLNQTSSNWIGAGLFLIGLMGAFAYFRRR